MGLFDFFRRSSKSRTHSIYLTDECVTHERADGTRETLRWDQLEEVGIVTTADGPFTEDVYWVLLGPDRRTGCAIPAFASGMDQLIARLQQLPDFDNDAVIRAMGSTTEARFQCWTKLRPD
jgi:hypothetical protein